MRRLNILTWHTHGIRVTAVVAGGMRTPFLPDRFPALDPALPVRETSWP
nr:MULTISPECIES: hypothetical protein [unclassified Massilia]